MHCAKALIRSRLWNPERHIERRQFPPIGQVWADQIGRGDDVEEVEKRYATNIRETLY